MKTHSGFPLNAELKLFMFEHRVKILLVEDDEDDYILTRDLLAEVKGTRYEIVWEPRYENALAAVCAGDHDVCLIDYRLGGGTGIEIIAEAHRRGARAPMILLTGQSEQAIDLEAAAAGAADYLVKGQLETLLLERSIRYSMLQSQMLETLRASEERFRSVIESASDAIILTDKYGTVISWNDGAQTIFGYTEKEILGESLALLLPESSCDAADGQAIFAAGVLRPGSRAVELTGRRITGEAFPLEISLSSWETTDGVFYGGIIRDVTERRRLEEQLTHQALHDPLTRLANRVLFRNRVEHALARADRRHEPLAVLFLDLDNFKTVNDSLGHAAGDQLLVAVAERLRACLRGGDTAARFGGDEFAVLIENADSTADAALVAERISQVLRPTFTLGDKEIFVGTSIGIAVTVEGDEKPEDLLRNADVAMYMAKNQGKDRYVVFESKMHAALMTRMETEADLRRAVEREEFLLHYQPIVDLRSGQLVGMETLVRWQHPARGIIAPLEFIPIAEETGLIIPLGEWILTTACRQVRAWLDEFGARDKFSLTVNLSARQLQQTDVAATIAAVLADSKLPPQNLVLEMTETIMLHNTEATIKKLRDLKALGVRLAIDDFGTGYSSLSYLQRFPIDILKIDKSFVDKINQNKEGAAMARAIIMMSDTLQLKTIAEGIERAEQAALLCELGCEFGQGYHYAKPLTAADLHEYLRRERRSDNFARPPQSSSGNSFDKLLPS